MDYHLLLESLKPRFEQGMIWNAKRQLGDDHIRQRTAWQSTPCQKLSVPNKAPRGLLLNCSSKAPRGVPSAWTVERQALLREPRLKLLRSRPQQAITSKQHKRMAICSQQIALNQLRQRCLEPCPITRRIRQVIHHNNLCLTLVIEWTAQLNCP